jgi:hypothetical protein
LGYRAIYDDDDGGGGDGFISKLNQKKKTHLKLFHKATVTAGRS